MVCSFYWKATPDSQDRAGVKCKMMRSVSFPETLDIFEFCNDRLQVRSRSATLEDIEGCSGNMVSKLHSLGSESLRF
jgi:hypothetical protein